MVKKDESSWNTCETYMEKKVPETSTKSISMLQDCNDKMHIYNYAGFQCKVTNARALLATCLNQGFTTTIASIIFLGVISSAEDSDFSKELCKNIDKKLDEFKKKVEDEGIEIGRLRFTSVDYLLCCDLKASNKEKLKGRKRYLPYS